MSYIVKVDGKEFKVDLQQDGTEYKVFLDGKEVKVTVAREDGSQLMLIVENRPFNVDMESDGRIFVNDEEYSIEVVDEQIQRLIKASPEKFHKKELSLIAPMPGLIIEVGVKEGDSVETGHGLLVVEAMKMQNEMKAPRGGIVKKVCVQKGQTVNSGETLIIME